ncbi:hypothetical protein MKZ12_07150 [Paenibacillus sp. FSL R5-0713]|uniref:hypothetical protein n=1 Tax=Paenibacillus sp. FSL R5-0713 TaxID=2921655 RepID=UPI0030DC0B17
MSKQEEIKQALAAATPGPWLLEEGWNDNPMMVMRPDRKVPVAELAFQNYENDANLIAKAPEYIAYLLADNERLEQRNQELDGWATEGFEENQKLVDERDRLRERFEEENSRHTKAIRLLMHVTDILSMGRTPDRAGAALQEIYKWLHENNPVGQEGEGNQ